MSIYKSKKGVTLIELVIALGLLSVIVAFVFSFFFANEKKLDEVTIKSDLQYEAKVVMDAISKYAMSATKVKYDTSIDPNTITFSLVDEDGAIIEDGAMFNINKPQITLIEKNADGTEIVSKTICSNSKIIKVSGNKEKNIDVKLTLEKDGVSYSIEEGFLFRNSHLK